MAIGRGADTMRLFDERSALRARVSRDGDARLRGLRPDGRALADRAGRAIGPPIARCSL